MNLIRVIKMISHLLTALTRIESSFILSRTCWLVVLSEGAITSSTSRGGHIRIQECNWNNIDSKRRKWKMKGIMLVALLHRQWFEVWKFLFLILFVIGKRGFSIAHYIARGAVTILSAQPVYWENPESNTSQQKNHGSPADQWIKRC